MPNLDGQESGPSLGVSMKTCNTETNNTIFQLTRVHGIRRDRILENSIYLFHLNDSDVAQMLHFKLGAFFPLYVHIVCHKQRGRCIRAREMAALTVNVVRCVLF